MILAKASLNYHCSFIVLATVTTIINYDRKTFIVQATGLFAKVGLGWIFVSKVKHSSLLL
jgi:hypothetical protein